MPSDEELLLEFYDVFNQRSVDAIPDFFAEDAVWHDDPDLPDGGDYEGREALTGRIRAYTEVMGRFQILNPQITPLGDGRYLAEFDLAVRGEGSGIAFSQPHAHLLWLANGRIAEATQVIDPRKMRRALGLE